ncbi:trypsin-like peptidase domain-containing protein [Nonomuraea angiospora]|uniref:trypsin-like peptidase domain-containing protein n=1 Tax=Nonomuraea angiospora TaxID=46172 RepID=UPI00344F714B
MGAEALVPAATVAITVPSLSSLGTGFFVGPGVVATCAHVLEPGLAIEGTLGGVALEFTCDPGHYFRDASGLDLAFLTVVGEPPQVTPVTLCGAAEVGDPLWTYGHPKGAFRAGQPATFRYEGSSLRSAEPGAPALPRLRGTPVAGGFSGSPVLNLRTGCVLGMLCTSDHKGSAHLLPAGEILARCPQPMRAHEEWLVLLSDEQIRASGLRYAGPRLRTYLSTAAHAARNHPNAGTRRAPQLPEVYFEQRARLGDTSEILTAAAIMELPDDCLLVGEPGAGKSIMLRHIMITLARCWIDGDGADVLPVLVPAAALTGGSLPEAIAAAVRAETLGWESPPPEFFREPPVAGVRWLVLVDGLDEVMAPDRRRDLLAALAALRAQRSAAGHRFLVATRPLDLDWNVRTLTLLPLESGELATFAAGYGIADPSAFAAAVANAGLIEVATTPLMAAMLCLIYAEQPGWALPSARQAIYRRFVELQHRHQFRDGADGVVQQSVTAVTRFGPGAVAGAEALRDRMPELVGRLALARHDGMSDPAADLIADWTAAQRPAQLSAADWTELVRELLRRCGLLVEEAGDFRFLHQTLLEFMAAGAIAADRDRSAAEIKRLRKAPTSQDLFLAGALAGDSRMVQALRKLARRLAGALFVAALIAEGAVDDPELIARATATLREGARKFKTSYQSDRLEAAFALVRLGAPEAADLLAALARTKEMNGPNQVLAAEALARLDASRGVALLLALAADPTPVLANQSRTDAAEALLHLGRPFDAGTAWTAQSVDASFGDDRRRYAADRLAEIGDPRAADVLAALATGDLRYINAVSAAGKLAGMGDPRGVAALTERALHDDDPLARGFAAETLARLGDPGDLVREAFADTLACAAADPELDVSRVTVAVALAELGDPRGAATLAQLATDPGLRDHLRSKALGKLCDLAPEEAVSALTDLAGDPVLRFQAVEALARVPGLDVSELWAALADASSALSPELIVRVAAEVGGRGDPRGNELLKGVVADPQVYDGYRLDAAKALADLGDRDAVELLAALATTIAPYARVGAAVAVAALDAERGARLLAGLAAEDSHAAAALARLRRPEGMLLLHAAARRESHPWAAERFVEYAGPDEADLLADLATDPGYVGVLAASRLLEVGDSRGVSLLTGFTGEALHPSLRIRAAAALCRAGSPAGRALLLQLASDRAQETAHRVWAARELADLGDPRALVQLAKDPEGKGKQRTDAIDRLAERDHPRVAELWAAIVADPALDDYYRRLARGRLTGHYPIDFEEW